MKLTNIELEYDTADYPDFCDAYITYAEIDGEPATEQQLDELNEDRDLVYDLVIKRIF